MLADKSVCGLFVLPVHMIHTMLSRRKLYIEETFHYKCQQHVARF